MTFKDMGDISEVFGKIIQFTENVHLGRLSPGIGFDKLDLIEYEHNSSFVIMKVDLSFVYLKPLCNDMLKKNLDKTFVFSVINSNYQSSFTIID